MIVHILKMCTADAGPEQNLVLLTEILHSNRDKKKMKHFKRDLSLKAWVLPPWVDLGVRTEAKLQLFSEYGYVAYQFKEDHTCNNMVANNVPRPPPPPRRQKVKIPLFSDYGHVAYQIKGNGKFSNM